MVVTGDHGEGLGERHWAHGWDLYNEDIRIPLLLYDAPAGSDLSGPVLRRAGGHRADDPRPPRATDSRLLGGTVAARADRPAVHVHQTYFLPESLRGALSRGDALFKFIATPQYGKEELYDLGRMETKRATSSRSSRNWPRFCATRCAPTFD